MPCQEPSEPAVTRSTQIQNKPEPGRGRGRGKGRGRGRGGGRGSGVEEAKENGEEWHFEEGLGWFWVGPEKPEKKPPAPKRSTKKPEKEQEVKAPPKRRRKKEPETPETVVEEKPEKAKKRKSEKTTEGAEPKKRSRASKKELKPIEPPPLTKKEQRKEIKAFLEVAKDLTDENARATLKSLLPNYGAHKFDCSPDIYWERKGVKGIGCGVRCQSEGKNVGYFGYRVQCDSWIYAIAAAIKSADIFVTVLQIRMIFEKNRFDM